MPTKKDLKLRFNLGRNTVYRTLQACPLGTKKRQYTEAEIEQYFIPARQMLIAGKTYQEVEQYFARNHPDEDELSELEKVKTNTNSYVVNEAQDTLNPATSLKSLARENLANSSNLSKRFRITYSTSQASARLAKVSNRESVTSYSQMSTTIQLIHQLGGTIHSITEAAPVSGFFNL